MKTFNRDLRKLHDRRTLDAVGETVRALEAADVLADVAGIESMTDHPGCFRIRVGDYRIGLYREGDRVELVRCLHRREIYRVFP